MQIQPNRESFKQLAQQGNLIPVYADLMADLETPVSAYAKLKQAGPSFLLESVEGGEHLSRYSFIGVRPRKIFACGPQTTTIRLADGALETVPTPDDPLTLIEAEMSGINPVSISGLPRFTGGAVGFIGYEYVTRVEPTVPMAPVDEHGLPLIYFMLVDSAAIFDRAKQTLRLCVNAHVGDNPDVAYDQAVAELNELAALLAEPNQLTPASLTELSAVKVPAGNFTQSRFEAVVDECKEFIRSGDIIQVVPSQRFSQPFHHTPLDLYRALRTVNPSPYMFILDTVDYAIVGASPEVHVRLTGDRVEIRPIAGTRKRGTTPEEDHALEKDLLADEKELAEHLMLVDLARNDIGRVCEYGSVHVPERNIIERYSHVMHIVSQVEGKIAADKSAYDLMRATFPAGTVSGAPKVRAMQIIASKEPVQRGFYAGALGYFGYDGNLDSCIMLRTSLLKDGQIHIQSGAGVVADSVPESEFFETVNKASALFKAVTLAEKL
ncbi:anthranilate synthase component I [Synoicihabitans lomoniglobus]|uniref:Anthranilate synthase component 1 n=1 Tax=Synoicihabitans lomoniglobus TaxID=2909285 RepID=A0AAF0CRE0_9BACT|nr:anthranilate synthase component I [Opitutaceae bacterium LMO-M01]WED66663.1 anthranilate synthase component I [Opitutaceae bacterium LMO-M01]